jgi:hypothetical protein
MRASRCRGRGLVAPRCGRVPVAAFRYSVRVNYQPMSMANLAAFIAGEPDFDMRWRLVVEFLKEYHHEPAGERQRLLTDTPEPVGDLRWDALFAGLAEHLAMRDGQDAPSWSASRGLRRFWFPFDTPGARAGSCPCSGRPPQAWRLRCRLRNRRGVSESSPLLDRAGIEDAFRRLGERLAKRGVVADLYVRLR